MPGKLARIFAAGFYWVAGAAAPEPATPAAPRYADATYGGESFTLQNRSMRLEVHKRLTGWAWAEIFDPEGRLVAVLDHLGEADLVGTGRLVPLRAEAAEYRIEKGNFGQRAVFPVRVRWYEALANTRFANPDLAAPVIEGTVTLTLAPDRPIARLACEYRPLKPLTARYLRGPWLRVGAAGFGAAKTDGIFPGVEWLRGTEWSSGTDWMQHPHALRAVLHPFKVTAPVMALSHHGAGIGLAWNPSAPVLAGRRYPQPVYASPNFIDRANHHLMGLSLPSVAWGMEENTPPVRSAKPPAFPLELRPDTPVTLEAEIFLAAGDSLDVLIDWVKRNGLPPPPPPRYSFEEALDRLARAYNASFWHEGKGWGRTAEEASPHPPLFLERYGKEGRDRETARQLEAKLAWARQELSSKGIRAGGRSGIRQFSLWSRQAQLAYGRELVSQQHADGSFRYDPDGRHKRDLAEIAAALLKPLGPKGAPALDITTQPAMELLILADLTGEKEFAAAARKALDFCLAMERPDGGDWWETPLYSPNLLAAGHSAIAYYLGYKAFQDRRYRDKAIHWLRSLLVFTHLWQPEEVTELYNTKPCLNQTIWFGSSWVDNHVQWEVLRTFAFSSDLGIDWGDVDPEIDWRRYQEGITTAVLRWMVDHTDAGHKATPPPADAELVKRGILDTYFYDVHDAVTGAYRGALIEPSIIGPNLWAVLDHRRR
jgi:hypothetical protein